MDGFVWRSRAKVVAYLDLIFTGITLFFVILAAIMTGVATAAVANIDKIQGDSNQNLFKDTNPEDVKAVMAVGVGILWIVVGIIGILSVVQLWAAIKLMNATEMGRDPMEAHGMASTWRIVSIIFLVLSIIGSLCVGTYIEMAISTVIRLVFIWIVCEFMTELRSTQNPSAPMTGISVMKH